jgi:hypothetical protein
MKGLLAECHGRQTLVLMMMCVSSAACGSRSRTEATPCLPCARAAAVPPYAEQGAARTAIDVVAERVMLHLQAADADGLFALFGPRMRQEFPIERVRDLVAGVAGEARE